MKTSKSYYHVVLFLFCSASTTTVNAQPVGAYKNKHLQKAHYSVADAHSHNDYEQQYPFVAAYNAMFGSMEADIFLEHDSLYIGHTITDVALHKTLSALYLDPLLEQIKLHNGFPYSDKKRKLQLLIDLKMDGVPTLATLVRLLKKYPAIIHSKFINIVITGNRPPVKDWPSYPSFILFDGNIGDRYPADVLPKIAMMSGDLATFTAWDGKAHIASQDSLKIALAISAVHAQGKKIRFWNAPDFPITWLQLIYFGVDWINTDHIQALAAFLGK